MATNSAFVFQTLSWLWSSNGSVWLAEACTRVVLKGLRDSGDNVYVGHFAIDLESACFARDLCFSR